MSTVVGIVAFVLFVAYYVYRAVEVTGWTRPNSIARLNQDIRALDDSAREARRKVESVDATDWPASHALWVALAESQEKLVRMMREDRNERRRQTMLGGPEVQAQLRRRAERVHRDVVRFTR